MIRIVIECIQPTARRRLNRLIRHGNPLLRLDGNVVASSDRNDIGAANIAAQEAALRIHATFRYHLEDTDNVQTAVGEFPIPPRFDTVFETCLTYRQTESHRA